MPLTVAQAVAARDALAKESYARVFLWLVERINASTGAALSGDAPTSASRGEIGLLDIFGFESFVVNRFEQLCINYANGAHAHCSPFACTYLTHISLRQKLRLLDKERLQQK